MRLAELSAALIIIAMPGTVPASAADLAGLQLRSAAADYDWGGSYAGADLGYAAGSSANSWASTSAGPWNLDGDIAYHSLTGSVHAGYQRQFDHFIIGGEADLTAGKLIGNDSQFAGFVNEIEIDSVATLRGRVGLAYGNYLAFATGGVAAADFYKRDLTNDFSGRNLATGWVAGLGAEMALDAHWRARIEYQHIGFAPVVTGIIAAGGGGYVHRADDPSLDLVRAGLSYAF